MPTSDFSGFESSDCALARAAASAAIDSLDRCMGGLRLKDIEADGAGFGAAGPDPAGAALLGVLGGERLELPLGSLVFDTSLARPEKNAGDFGPAVRGAHVDHTDGLN